MGPRGTHLSVSRYNSSLTPHACFAEQFTLERALRGLQQQLEERPKVDAKNDFLQCSGGGEWTRADERRAIAAAQASVDDKGPLREFLASDGTIAPAPPAPDVPSFDALLHSGSAESSSDSTAKRESLDASARADDKKAAIQSNAIDAAIGTAATASAPQAAATSAATTPTIATNVASGLESSAALPMVQSESAHGASN